MFEGSTEFRRGYRIANAEGESLKGKFFEFHFDVDKSLLSDVDSSNNKARFVEGLTKSFFRIGDDEGDLYEGQGDLTDYEINIHNDVDGKDRFEIKFHNFFGDNVLKNSRSIAPKNFTIKLEEGSGSVLDEDPTAENFPESFDIDDWCGAHFEIEWQSGTRLGGCFYDLHGGTAVPEPAQIIAFTLLALGSGIYLLRLRFNKLNLSSEA